MVYQIKMEFFEGPLDLLLNLIEKEKLEVNKVSLAKVTDQYVKRIASQEKSEDVADFLIVASKLLYLKSKSLLPKIEEEQAEEEIEELQQKLIEYKKFKEAANDLQEILKENLRGFEIKRAEVFEEHFIPPSEVSPQDLAQMLLKILEKMPKEMPEAQKREVRKVTISEKLDEIVLKIKSKKKINFSGLIKESAEKGEVLVSFLALLEGIKRKIFIVEQKSNFADLIIRGV